VFITVAFFNYFAEYNLADFMYLERILRKYFIKNPQHNNIQNPEHIRTVKLKLELTVLQQLKGNKKKILKIYLVITSNPQCILPFNFTLRPPSSTHQTARAVKRKPKKKSSKYI
jgi:hypothetical protein